MGDMIIPVVNDRPMTKNGLAGFRPATTHAGRITKDSLFWLGKIKSTFLQNSKLDFQLLKTHLNCYLAKMREISEEIESLENEQNNILQENEVSDLNLFLLILF